MRHCGFGVRQPSWTRWESRWAHARADGCACTFSGFSHKGPCCERAHAPSGGGGEALADCPRSHALIVLDITCSGKNFLTVTRSAGSSRRPPAA